MAISPHANNCPDCAVDQNGLADQGRRTFLKSAVTASGLLAFDGLPSLAKRLRAEPVAASPPQAETLVHKLFEELNEKQRAKICFDWDYRDPDRGLLRTHVANNWNITEHSINSKFFSDDQRDLIKAIFEGIIHPDWRERYHQQLLDDCGGFGEGQSIAIFGQPGESTKFEFVLTGRHITLRCDGNSTDHVAFGGPIFYGHAPQEEEDPKHPGNVFWEQAEMANQLYAMLDGRQRKLALVPTAPHESQVAFQGAQAAKPGIVVSELSGDQRDHLRSVLNKLVAPFRKIDADEALACLDRQGGLEQCSLAFYQNSDIGNDGVWDNWRLEGPSFVWYFRGDPHVHVWVNVADDASIPLNAS